MADYKTPREGASTDTEYSKGKHANIPGSGVYRHPETGREVIVQDDPLYGNAQAQGFVRVGFKFVREAKPEEITTLPELAADSRKAGESDVKGLSARLDKLEEVADENKSLKAEIEELRQEKADREEADRQAAEKAKADEEATKTKEAEDKKKTEEDAKKATPQGGNQKEGK